jgi:hypothetical protein
MQQRRLRLGDILDDYCPRERRITNHAVVAMIDDQVKQTRCTTCDADHEYKQAKVPPARRKKLEGAALGDAAEAMLRRPDAEPDAEPDTAPAVDAEPIEAEPVEAEAVQQPVDGVVIPDDAPAAAAVEEPASDEEPVAASGEDDGPVHRRLIRATLPRPEGQVPERKIPDFTIRQPGGRGGRGEFDGNRNGQRPGRGGGGRPMRFGGGGGAGAGGGKGPRHGSGQGQRPGGGNRARDGQRGGGRPGPGGGPGHGRGGGGRKRGR